MEILYYEKNYRSVIGGFDRVLHCGSTGIARCGDQEVYRVWMGVWLLQ
jgi:hypothetical protein